MIECKQCGECCKNLVVSVDVSSDDAKEFYNIRGFSFKNDVLYLVLPLRCPHLTMDNKCDIHSTKPVICKDYPANVPSIVIPNSCVWKVKKDG